MPAYSEHSLVGPSRRKMPEIILCWDHYSEYHFARLRDATKAAETLGLTLRPVQFSKSNESHAWSDSKSAEPVNLVKLESSSTISLPELSRFATKALRLLWQKDAIVFVPSYWPIKSAIFLLIANSLRIPAIMMNDTHDKTASPRSIRTIVKRILISLFSAGFVAGKPQIRYFLSLGMTKKSLFTGYDSIDGKTLAKNSQNPSYVNKLHEIYRTPKGCILSLGRLVEKKNLASLVRAYIQLLSDPSKRYPALVIVGEGPEYMRLAKIVSESGTRALFFSEGADFENEQNAIIFYPFCRNHEVAYFYSRCAIFVLPSTQEEWGLVVNEAVACGKPVIVSCNAGCSEDLVEHNRNGYVFDPNELDHLTSLIRQFLDNEEIQFSMQSAAKARAPLADIHFFSDGLISSAMYVDRNLNGEWII